MSVWGTEDLMSEEEPWVKGKHSFKLGKDSKITVLSGAGISAESGVPTFRGPGGLWDDESLVKLATPRGFMADPVRGWRFYDERRQNMAQSQPNPAHRAIARMEQAGYDMVVITQNIDRLHQAAGSSRVIELHGTLWEIRCTNPACVSRPFENHDVPLKDIPLVCGLCGSVMRPNVVFFEEMLDSHVISEADRRTKQTDLFIVVGTSGIVYPAAGFTHVARMSGAYIVEMNIEPTPLTPICDETVLGPCGETLPGFFTRLTGGEIGFP